VREGGGARFEVFTAMKIEFVVFWVVAPEDGGSMVLRNTGIQPPHYMVKNLVEEESRQPVINHDMKCVLPRVTHIH
jgi:hypothetical protein